MAFTSVASALRTVATLAVVAGLCLGLAPLVVTWRAYGVPRWRDLTSASADVYSILGGVALLALLGALAVGVRLTGRVRNLEKRVAGRRTGPVRVGPVRVRPAHAQNNLDAAAHAATVARLTEVASHAEHEAHRVTLKLAALLEQSPDAILLFDSEGMVVDANVRARALLGKERAELARLNLVALVAPQPSEQMPGRQASEQMPEPTSGQTRPTARAEAYHAFMACLRGVPSLFETTLLSADGGARPVEIHLAPLHGLRGVAAQAVVRELTRRSEREIARAEAAKMEGVGTLAAGIAHDFNNVLGGIMGYASLIKGSVVEGDPVFRYTDIIERSAARASELTEQLLGYARAGKMRLSRVHPRELADEVLALLHQTLSLHGVTVRLQAEADLSALEGDAGQLHRVLTNLCLNACDAMTDGGALTVAVRMRELAPGDGALPMDQSGGTYVEIAVSDTGKGIPPEVRRRMFEPFFTTKHEASGTGLGLAMAWGIVANHRGWIGVDSEVGKGSTLSVFLPAMRQRMADDAPEFFALAEPDTEPGVAEHGTAEPTSSAPLPELETPFRPQPVPAAAPAPPAPTVEPSRTVSGGHAMDRAMGRATGATILVVDDEPTLLEMAQDILKSRGYTVLLARDGAEAVDIYRRHRATIDLVILDIVMPRMGGKEAFRHLREMDPHVRVVVCSTFSRHGQAYDLLQAGADEFIQKPYRADDMLGVVVRVLGGLPAPDQGARLPF